MIHHICSTHSAILARLLAIGVVLAGMLLPGLVEWLL